MSRLYIPGEIHLMGSGEFASESLGWAHGKRVLLVMNSSQDTRLKLQHWFSNLQQRSFQVIRIHSTPSNPDVTDVQRALQASEDSVPDIVLAVGGGSSIDMSKALVALWYLRNPAVSRDDVLRSIKTKEYLQHPSHIPIYAIPTTAGTGAEVTKWATIWDKQGQVKLSIEAPWLCPTRACIVPEFTISMPSRLTLSTGLDALCQGVEAYWARASNPMVRQLSLTSIRLLTDYLPKVLSDAGNVAYREKVSLGALFSGLAFSQTRTTACHSLSYPLTMMFGIEHGLACAISLAKVLQINLPGVLESAELLGALGVDTPEGLQDWLDVTSEGIVKMRLSWFGVRQQDLAAIAEEAYTPGRMDNNPVEIDANRLSWLLHSIL